VYKKRKCGERRQVELEEYIRIFGTPKNAQETFLRSVLRNEGNCWSEFYKIVKRRKGNRVSIPTIKDHNGTIITDSTEKLTS